MNSLRGRTVGVVGLGPMGQGIALTMALSGARVLVMDNDAELTAHLAQKIRDEAVVQGAAIDLAEADLGELGRADLVVEAIVESMAAKVDLFARLADTASDDLLVASNTSSLSIGEMGRAFCDPSRVVGMHFFNPPTKMRLVEVVRSEATSDQSVQRATEFVNALGKTAVVCADSPNFIVNRICRPLYYEAELLVTQGVECARVDATARGALGHPMGPLELLDFTGLHTHLASSETALREFGESRYRPIPLVRRLVRNGMTGRTVGRGFYDYAKETPRVARERVTESSTFARVPFVVIGPGAVDWDVARGARLDDEIVVYSCPGLATRTDVERVREISQSHQVVVDSSDGVWREALPDGVGWIRVHHTEGAPFVEIVEDDVAAVRRTAAADLVLASIGANMVSVPALPGLVADRLQWCLINEAAAVFEEGTATRDDIDVALTLGMNHPRGPFAALDAIGASRVVDGLMMLLREFGDSRYRPSQWLVRRAAAERRS